MFYIIDTITATGTLRVWSDWSLFTRCHCYKRFFFVTDKLECLSMTNYYSLVMFGGEARSLPQREVPERFWPYSQVLD